MYRAEAKTDINICPRINSAIFYIDRTMFCKLIVLLFFTELQSQVEALDKRVQQTRHNLKTLNNYKV